MTTCKHDYKAARSIGGSWPTKWVCAHCGDVFYDTVPPATSAEVRRQLGPTGKERTR